jgi:hypothetical protein
MSLCAMNRPFHIHSHNASIPRLGSSGPDSVEVSYLDKLDSALRSRNDEAVDRTIGEISGHLSILCQPFFRELALNYQNENLETCYNPKRYYFQIVTRNGKAKVITRDHYELIYSTNTPIYCGGDGCTV